MKWDCSANDTEQGYVPLAELEGSCLNQCKAKEECMKQC